MGCSQDDVATEHRVDLWCFFYQEALCDEALVSAYQAILAPSEKAHYDACTHESSRRMYLATRALVRATLSRYADRPPESWRFAKGQRGKPQLETMPSCGPLYFNLSHTEDLVLCAVSRSVQRLGIDVENHRRSVRFGALVKRHFSACEAATWQAQPPQVQPLDFFRYWTLKECFTKAIGEGLHMALNAFEFVLPRFSVESGHDVIANFHPELGEHVENWRFVQWLIRPSFVVSLAAETMKIPLRCAVRSTVPLSEPDLP